MVNRNTSKVSSINRIESTMHNSNRISADTGADSQGSFLKLSQQEDEKESLTHGKGFLEWLLSGVRVVFWQPEQTESRWSHKHSAPSSIFERLMRFEIQQLRAKFDYVSEHQKAWVLNNFASYLVYPQREKGNEKIQSGAVNCKSSKTWWKINWNFRSDPRAKAGNLSVQNMSGCHGGKFFNISWQILY